MSTGGAGGWKKAAGSIPRGWGPFSFSDTLPPTHQDGGGGGGHPTRLADHRHTVHDDLEPAAASCKPRTPTDGLKPVALTQLQPDPFPHGHARSAASGQRFRGSACQGRGLGPGRSRWRSSGRPDRRSAPRSRTAGWGPPDGPPWQATTAAAGGGVGSMHVICPYLIICPYLPGVWRSNSQLIVSVSMVSEWAESKKKFFTFQYGENAGKNILAKKGDDLGERSAF